MCSEATLISIAAATDEGLERNTDEELHIRARKLAPANSNGHPRPDPRLDI